MTRDFTLRLIGADTTDGEIELGRLATLAAALAELSLRTTRDALGAAERGRPPRLVEEVSSIRLGAITAGSTCLTFRRGADVLDPAFDEAGSDQARFWDVVERVFEGRADDSIPDPVADSAYALAVALSQAAPRFTLEHANRLIESSSTRVQPTIWRRPGHQTTADHVTLVGLLERVDLHTHDFRIRDDVGQTFDLYDVVGPATVAQLIGRHVRASGPARVNRSGVLTGIEAAELVADEAVAGVPLRVSLAEILQGRPEQIVEGRIELSDEEFDSFLAGARS